jgi:hypothetical protein
MIIRLEKSFIFNHLEIAKTDVDYPVSNLDPISTAQEGCQLWQRDD